MTEILSSSWLPVFKKFVSEPTTELYLVAPYITAWPLSWVGEFLKDPVNRPARVCLVTDFNVASLQSGSLSIQAITRFLEAVPTAQVSHLPRLHTKIYLNHQTAIITSANLTHGGLLHNEECGVKLTDPSAVAQTRSNVLNYLEIGSSMPLNTLVEIADCVEDLHLTSEKQQCSRYADNPLNKLIRAQQEALATQLIAGRVQTESIEGIFRRTIMAVLRRHGSLSTPSVHALVRELQPDLCDETTNRVINGVSFGKKWKHQIRSAQVALKRAGLVVYDKGLWRLPG